MREGFTKEELSSMSVSVAVTEVHFDNVKPRGNIWMRLVISVGGSIILLAPVDKSAAKRLHRKRHIPSGTEVYALVSEGASAYAMTGELGVLPHVVCASVIDPACGGQPVEILSNRGMQQCTRPWAIHW